MRYKAFSDVLATSLRKHYGGRIPSFATIARDFALHSPTGLAPISVETPRKWMRGESLPSLERLQTLANWLGSEILEPLNGKFLGKSSSTDGEVASTSDVTEIAELLKQLTSDELESISQLLHHLIDAHKNSRTNEKD